MNLQELKDRFEVLSVIDWEMTPEEAVTLYLEWGNNWAHGNHLVRSKDDVSYYFVVNTWKKKPIVYFIKRNSDEAVELAEFRMPINLEQEFLNDIGYNKGVYALNEPIKSWLKQQLNLN